MYQKLRKMASTTDDKVCHCVRVRGIPKSTHKSLKTSQRFGHKVKHFEVLHRQFKSTPECVLYSFSQHYISIAYMIKKGSGVGVLVGVLKGFFFLLAELSLFDSSELSLRHKNTSGFPVLIYMVTEEVSAQSLA